MGWEYKTMRFGADNIAGHVCRDVVTKAFISWRSDIVLGTRISIGEYDYIVEEIRDPGTRHETLELSLSFVGNHMKAKISAQSSSKKRKATKQEARHGG